MHNYERKMDTSHRVKYENYVFLFDQIEDIEQHVSEEKLFLCIMAKTFEFLYIRHEYD